MMSDRATNRCSIKTARSPVEFSRVRMARDVPSTFLATSAGGPRHESEAGRASRRRLRTSVVDADVRRAARPRDESLRNQDDALSGRVVSSSDGFDMSTVLATCADNSGQESQAGRASRRKLCIRVIGAGARPTARSHEESLGNQDGALSGRVVLSSDGFNVSSTVLATCANNSGHKSEAGRASRCKLRIRVIGADARRTARSHERSLRNQDGARSGRVLSSSND
jgi:hypothetical protein